MTVKTHWLEVRTVLELRPLDPTVASQQCRASQDEPHSLWYVREAEDGSDELCLWDLAAPVAQQVVDFCSRPRLLWSAATSWLTFACALAPPVPTLEAGGARPSRAGCSARRGGGGGGEAGGRAGATRGHGTLSPLC